MNTRALKFSALLLAAAAMPAAAQSIPTLAARAATAFSANGGVNDLAFNDKSNVYLQVWGHPAVWGAFVSADGALLGAPFLIAAQSQSDSLPRVAYSQGSADDVFWVTFTSEFAGRYIYSRLIRYVPTAPGLHEMGPIQPVSTAAGGPLQSTGGIVFDPARRQFFATWDGLPGGNWDAFGQVWQLSGSTAAPAIAPASAVLNISAATNAQGMPNVAFDWQHNRYLVVYAGETPQSDLVNASWAKTVTFDGAMNPTYSDMIRLSNSGGRPIEQNVLYAPEVDGFLTFWTDMTSVRDVSGIMLNHSGAGLTAAAFPIMATPSNEGAADAAYNPGTRSILMAAMRDQTKYAQGVMLTGTGSIIEYFQATSVLPSGSLETLYPQVASAAANRFGVSYMNTFQFGYVDILQGAAGVGGGPLPPPPPPACAVEPLPGTTSVSLTGAAQSRTITVTASTADCAWTATSSASWLTITAGASGAGPGTTTYAVTRNTSGATRSATVTIGAGLVTVVQAPSLTNGALHDISGDRASDLMWHNVSTGRVAVWNIEGWTVKATYYLTSVPVDTSWKVVGTGDLNGDGFADVVWKHSGGGVAVWFLQNGQIVGTQYLVLDGAPAVEADPSWEIRAVGDLDGDGKADIIWQNMAVGTLGVWYMDGITVTSRASFNIGMADANWKIAGAGDINQDGKADVIWQNHATGLIGAWLMDGHQVVGQSNLSIDRVTNLDWKIAGVGDTNGDGYADLLWQNMSTGGLGVWFLNNFTVLLTRSLSISAVTDPANWRVVGPG